MENIQERLRDARRTRDTALIIQLMREQEEARNNPVEEEEEEERCGDFYQIDAVESEFCNGREDPISREVIQDGDGVCIRGNCYSRDSIRESILTNAFIDPITRRRNAFIDPITRSSFTMDSFGFEYHRNMVDTLIARLQEVQTRLDLCLEYNGNALIAAAGRGQAEIVRILIAGANVEATERSGSTALILAAASGHAEIVQLLLNAGANVDATSNDGNTALILAAESGHAETVRRLLDARANMEFLGETDNIEKTALTAAALRGHTEIVKILLDRGANVDATDNAGFTALMGGWNGRPESVPIVRLLLAADADVEATNNDGDTALIEAAQNGDAEIVPLLLAAGANVNATNNYEVTALMYAALEGDAESVRLLLAAGANVDATDNNGDTALRFAADNGHTEIVRLIRRFRLDRVNNARVARASDLAGLNRIWRYHALPEDLEVEMADLF